MLGGQSEDMNASHDSFQDESDESCQEDEKVAKKRKDHIESLTQHYEEYHKMVQKERNDDSFVYQELTQQEMQEGFIKYRQEHRMKNQSEELQFTLNKLASYIDKEQNEQ